MKKTQKEKVDYIIKEKASEPDNLLAEKPKLYIKNMVSNRCKLLVKLILAELDIAFITVELGEIILEESISSRKKEQLRYCLLQSGLILIENQKAILVEKIKAVIIEMVHYAEEFPNIKYSVHISSKLNHSYTYLANIFSEIRGTTIEQFIILNKIEKVKELLFYNEYNITKIACKLNYSSGAHLSSQFKQVTGLTPSFFKKLRLNRQQPLEAL